MQHHAGQEGLLEREGGPLSGASGKETGFPGPRELYTAAREGRHRGRPHFTDAETDIKKPPPIAGI